MRDDFAGNVLPESLLRHMPCVVGSSAMTVGFPTTSLNRRNITRLKITALGELLQEAITAVEEFRQRIDHRKLLKMI